MSELLISILVGALNVLAQLLVGLVGVFTATAYNTLPGYGAKPTSLANLLAGLIRLVARHPWRFGAVVGVVGISVVVAWMAR